MSELKPCPFCGADAKLQTKGRYKDGRHIVEYRVIDTNVGCAIFPATKWCATKTEAVKAWESRVGEGEKDGL